MKDQFIEDLVESRKIKGFIEDEINQTITIFEEEYPELSQEFKDIQDEMYRMFAAKHMDYGLQNISLGGDLTIENDKKFSLTGLAIRLTDKISRLRNLLTNGRNFVKGEGMEDTFIDICLLYTSPSPRDRQKSRMPSSA